jgi:subtilisin family serine protease
MPASYRHDVILAPASALRPGEIDRLNDLLHDAGLGRPLRHPEDSPSEVAMLPVHSADPRAVRDALRRVPTERGEDLPELTLDFQYAAHTVEDDAKDREVFTADGKPSGHGMMGWLSAPAYAMRKAPPRQPVHRRPVVALLDTRVEQHNWLQQDLGGDPFVLAATGWEPLPIQRLPKGHEGSHRGHGTFLTGLIRLTAPDAYVLPVQVMADNGQVSHYNVVKALEWLVKHNHDQRRVEVVCMAFGGPADDDLPLKELKCALKQLGDQDVKIVASAGNDGHEDPQYPAAFATDPELSVVSVGARRSATERAPYSNYGVWVREWGEGTNVISIMPMTAPVHAPVEDPKMVAEVDVDGYAWWSGTSFAAATYAASLAQRTLTNEMLPAGAARP